MRFPEKYKVVPCGSDINLATGATQDTDSINMSRYHHATFIISMGTLGGADTVITVNSGATDGACTTAETFTAAFMGATHLWGSAGATADVLAAETSAASVTVANATHDNFVLVIEIDATAMTADQEWLTVRFTDAGGSTGLCTAIAILEPIYGGNRSVTALA